MEKLIKQAIKALEKNPLINEIQLDDGASKVRVIRNAPNITCWATWPYTHPYTPPQY